jgi:hypothetical protein
MMFCGISEPVYNQLKETGIIELIGEENVFPDSSILLYSSQQALKTAERWLADNPEEYMGENEDQRPEV